METTEFLFTDTWDSLLVEMQTENIYKYLREGKGAEKVCGQRDNQAGEIQKVPPGEEEAVGKHEHAQS